MQFSRCIADKDTHDPPNTFLIKAFSDIWLTSDCLRRKYYRNKQLYNTSTTGTIQQWRSQGAVGAVAPLLGWLAKKFDVLFMQ
jgi:hypothetical protein